MSTDFCPTRVPAGTLQDMAKRLSKHPQMKDVPLSKCQEILAQTFGHASFHALKTRQPASRAAEGFRDVATRLRFYTMLEEPLRAHVDLVSALTWIEELSRRGGQWPLADLSRACQESIGSGLTLAQSLEALGTDAQAPEYFLLARWEEQGDLAGGVKEARILAEQEAHIDDMRRLSGQLPSETPPTPSITRVSRMNVPKGQVGKVREALSQAQTRTRGARSTMGEQP